MAELTLAARGIAEKLLLALELILQDENGVLWVDLTEEAAFRGGLSLRYRSV